MAGVPGDQLITGVTDDATHVSPMSRLKTARRGWIRTFDLLIQSQATESGLDIRRLSVRRASVGRRIG